MGCALFDTVVHSWEPFSDWAVFSLQQISWWIRRFPGQKHDLLKKANKLLSRNALNLVKRNPFVYGGIRDFPFRTKRLSCDSDLRVCFARNIAGRKHCHSACAWIYFFGSKMARMSAASAREAQVPKTSGHCSRKSWSTWKMILKSKWRREMDTPITATGTSSASLSTELHHKCN